MSERIRQLLMGNLGNNKGYRSWESIVGYKKQALLDHLEANMKPGMSFDNYGEWHIDHIVPCCKFDLTDDDQVKSCWALSNLQPLWATENKSKGGR